MNSKNLQPNQDLVISIVVPKTPKEAFEAIKDVKAWWVGDVKGDAKQTGSKFTYRYKEFHYSSQVVTEMEMNKKIVWHVDDAAIGFTEDKNEWTGTDLIFEIFPRAEKTEIKFTHRGLTPKLECFEACSAGWEFYITKSLKNFLLEGQGLDPGI